MNCLLPGGVVTRIGDCRFLSDRGFPLSDPVSSHTLSSSCKLILTGYNFPLTTDQMLYLQLL